MSTADPIPEGFHTVSPYLIIENASEAIEFYSRAFGAEELERHRAPGGQGVMHARLRIGDSMIMIADEFPEWGSLGPQSIGGTAVSIHIYTEDADALFQRALDAGATAKFPIDDTFWGDRFGKLEDPFGHEWSIATHVKDMTAEEVEQAAVAAFSPDDSP